MGLTGGSSGVNMLEVITVFKRNGLLLKLHNSLDYQYIQIVEVSHSE